MTEREFQTQVIQLARLCGWRVAHFRPARMKDGSWRTAVQGDGAGFPDLVLVRGPKVLWVELKAENGGLTERQCEWRRVLLKAGQDYRLWVPSKWPEVEATLTGAKCEE